MQTSATIVFITTPSQAVAAELARCLVAQKLAACANLVGPIRSIYTWKGEIQDDEEVLLVVKTRSELFERLAAAVQAIHPYELPEIIALPVAAGLPAYLEWIAASTGAEDHS